ncbi:uncharacterized protein LOC144165042 [Haemaphysalis longicornis]
MVQVLATSALAFSFGALFASACKIEPKDAVFFATNIGRATHYFFKNCSHYLRELRPHPPPEVTIKFLASVCTSLDSCSERSPEATFLEIVPCVQEDMWRIWGPTPYAPLEHKQAVEKMLLCVNTVVPSVTVGKHLIAYLLKISG